ncbi:MAG: NAD(+) diphosphatase [Acidothermales bacterium]|nr:NAD(+) diphosphatase [Acidothermales bacterium]
MSRRGLGGALPLARAVVDRAAHRRSDDAWLAAADADPSTLVLVVDDGRVLVRGDAAGDAAGNGAGDGDGGGDGGVALALLPASAAPPGERYLLGEDGTGAAYLAVTAALPELPGTRPEGLREVGALLDDRDVGLLTHAVALERWHGAHPRCAQCGALTEPAAAGHVRRCPACGAEHYPRTDPAVIMLVTDDSDRCLLGRQSRWPPRRFSTLAGFVEPGESLEQAVAREVLEEVGIAVTDVTYLASQPWPFPSSLMLGFTARAGGVDLRPDGVEIAEAQWFTRGELAGAVSGGDVRLPPPVSIARRLIEGWYGDPLPDSPVS